MKMFLVLLALLMALFLAACGGGAATDTPVETDAPVEETEAEPTVAEPTVAPTDTAVPAAAGAVADVFPCEARAVEDQGSVLRVVYRLPDPGSPIVGARRAGQAFSITEVQTDSAGGTWYNVYEANRTVGWIQPQYVILNAECISGAGGAEATESAEVEATAEATEE